MGLFSFGSKKGKVKKMIDEERFEEVVNRASKDKKMLKALIELLNDPNPGIVGDSLLLLSNIIENNPEAVKSELTEELFNKLMNFIESGNPYVKENAMILSYKIVRTFPEIASKYRSWLIESIEKGLREWNKEQKGFLLIVIGELHLTELRPLVEELTNVEDKVVLPFEGKKWVSIGEIARETLEKL